MEEIKRELFLIGTINPETSKEIIEAIVNINIYDNFQTEYIVDYERAPILLYVSTHGGYVDDTLALYDIIRLSETPVYVIVMGYAQSGGLFIALAGDKSYISPNGHIMYHQMWYGQEGTLENHNEYADRMGTSQARLHKIITESTKISKDKLLEKDDKKQDWYIDAKECVELGIVDDILSYE